MEALPRTGAEASAAADPAYAVAAGFRLDPTHLRILQILERDGRMSVARIAREVGLTDNAVRHRLHRLRASGILRRVTVHVDPTRLGRSRTGIMLLRLEPGADLQRIRQHPAVAMMLPTRGPYQAVVLLTARDHVDMDALQQTLRREPGVVDATALDVTPGADAPVPPSACLGGPPRDPPPAN